MARVDEKRERDAKPRAVSEPELPPPSTAPHSTVNGLRRPLPTLPDGVPAELWEDAVESERFLTE